MSARASVLCLLLAAGFPARVVGRLGAPKHGLCAEAIVRETCSMLDSSGSGVATPEAVGGIFASTAASVEAFWARAGLPMQGAACADLCGNATALLKSLGRQLPQSSDLGCYEGAVGGDCELDLAPDAIQGMAASSADFPFSEGDEHEHHHDDDGDNETEVVAFSYTVEEMAVRVAQLFRIYPALDSDVQIVASQGPRMLTASAETELLTRRLRQSQAYVNIALRTFASNRTREETKMFFGSDAVSSQRARARIQMVMNSVNNVLSNATFVYPGPDCSARIFAYVFPCTNGGPSEKDTSGRFYVHLCDLFFTVREEQICTLVHEASHHAAACTSDVEYGAAGCKRLAHTNPQDALRNADNYGYYIREVARSFGTF